MDMRINGGYFILRNEIFDYLHPGDDLVTETFTRAARAGRFRAVRFDGFWAPMDTLKARSAGGDAPEWQPSLGTVGCVARHQIRASPARANPADANRFVRRCVIRRTARIRGVSRAQTRCCNATSEPSRRLGLKLVCIAAPPDDVEIAAWRNVACPRRAGRCRGSLADLDRFTRPSCRGGGSSQAFLPDSESRFQASGRAASPAH